ncbi:MAG: chemotaxis protein CheB [Planctomycetota bacterium]
MERDVGNSGQRSDDAKSARPLAPPRFVVALGASAGGQDAVEAFLHALPPTRGIAFVLVSHLAPGRRSALPQILSRSTKLPVLTVQDGMTLKADHFFVLPPGNTMSLEGPRLRLRPRTNELEQPIDVFLQSMAKSLGHRAMAIILSGAGSDGTLGIRSIKAVGGIVMVQDDSAQFDGMPSNAIRTGLADFILPPEALAEHVVRVTGRDPADLLELANDDAARETILHALAEHTTQDFTMRRRSILDSHIKKRAWLRHAADLKTYADMVAREPQEAQKLAKDLLLSTQEFLRYPDSLAELEETIFPEILVAGASIRVWIVGCGSGEEAYSLTVLIDRYVRQHNVSAEFRVFATDLNEEDVGNASRGVFTEPQLQQFDEDTRDAVFTKTGESFTVHRRIRDRIVFARHDVTNDAPFTRMDLVVCRDLLVSLEAPSQSQVMRALTFSLRPGGYLLLGPEESSSLTTQFYTPVGDVGTLHRRGTESVHYSQSIKTQTTPSSRIEIERDRLKRECDALAKLCSNISHDAEQATVLLDSEDRILFTFGDTGRYFRLQEGRTSRELDSSLLPDLSRVCSSMLRKLRESKTTTSDVTMLLELPEHGVERIHVQGMRLETEGRTSFHALVLTSAGAGTPEGEGSDSGSLGSAATQFAASNEQMVELQSALQETLAAAEVSERELQQSNRRLSVSNNKLQSSNEQLHSVNEELQAVNIEYQKRLAEQQRLTADMEHLLQSSDLAAIFIDSSGIVRRFTPAVANLVPLLPPDVGRPISNIKHELFELDFERLSQKAQETRSRIDRRILTAENRTLLVRAAPYVDYSKEIDGAVLSFVDVTELVSAQQAAAEKEQQFEQIAAHIDEVIWVRDRKTRDFTYISPVIERLWGVTAKRLTEDAELWLKPVHPDDRDAVVQAYDQGIVSGQMQIEYRILTAGTVRWLRDRTFPITDGSGHISQLAGVTTDITHSKAAEDQLRSTAEEMSQLAMHDPLTNLANRRGLEQVLKTEISRMTRNSSTLSAVLIDCDDFKQVNERHGHSGGDRALREIASRLGGALRPTDTLARVGGDEFVALMPETRHAEALHVAERMRKLVGNEPMTFRDADQTMTVSLGVQSVDASIKNVTDLLEHLQEALAQSKQGGKNIVATTPEGHQPTARTTDFLAGLSQPGALRAFAQSLHDLDTGETLGYELLVRGPKGAMEKPSDLLRMARTHDVLGTVDQLCLMTCTRAAALAGKDQQATRPRRLHLNIFPSTLQQMVADQNIQIFETLGALGNCCIELSEQEIIGDPARLRSSVDLLRGLGLMFAVDDVGFGKSSLETLIVLEPDVIKIDRAYVSGADVDSIRRSCLQRLVRVAQALKAEVIAEGVETETERALLRELDLRYAQGFLWSQPNQVDELAPWQVSSTKPDATAHADGKGPRIAEPEKAKPRRSGAAKPPRKRHS